MVLFIKVSTHFPDEILFSFMYNVAFNKKIYVKFSNFDFPISSATFEGKNSIVTATSSYD